MEQSCAQCAARRAWTPRSERCTRSPSHHAAVRLHLLLLCALHVIHVAGAATLPSFMDFRLLEEPADLVAVQGASAVLNCSSFYAGGAKVKVKWYKNEIPITPDRRRSVLSNGSLYFTDIVHTRAARPDQGRYFCLVSVTGPDGNDVTLRSRVASLSVASLDTQVRREPRHVRQYQKGDTAFIYCDVSGTPRPQVSWFRNGVEMQASDHVILHESGALELRHLRLSDYQNYHCRARNAQGSKQGAPLRLMENKTLTSGEGEAPWLEVRPQSKQAVAGQQLVLLCAANGRDASKLAPSITWLKDGVRINLQLSDGKYSRVGSGSLLIRSLRARLDSGTYTCRAQNQLDAVDASAFINVNAGVSVVERPRNQYARRNQDVVLRCRVSGSPPLTVRWAKDGRLLAASEYVKMEENSQLRILGPVQSDSGFYQCLGSNSLGNVQAAAQLLVLPQETAAVTPHLGPPRNLRAQVVGSRFVTLSWSAPERVAGQALSYHVSWEQHGSSRQRSLTTSGVKANIQQLQPSTTYKFWVTSVTSQGRSTTPARLQVRTFDENHVPGQVREVRAEATLKRSAQGEAQHGLLVTWLAPAGEQHVREYTVYYYREGEEVERNISIPAGRTSVRLTSLSAATSYVFRVTARNRNGHGPSSPLVRVSTYEDVPSAPPRNVTVEADGSKMLRVTWEPPGEEDQRGVIIGYKIRFRKADGSRAESRTAAGDQRVLKITKLERDTEYRLRVAAMTSNGTGRFSEWQRVRTLKQDMHESRSPGKPRHIRVESREDSLLITWDPPAEDVPVTNYLLGYGRHTPHDFSIELEAYRNSYVIKNLEPMTMYQMSMNTVRYMSLSTPVFFEGKTLESGEFSKSPSRLPTPVGVKAQVLADTTILLTWSDQTLGEKVTQVPAGDPRYYTIRCTKAGSTEDMYRNTTELNEFFDNLEPATRYGFAVLVTSGSARSVWSLRAFNVTLDALPATAPREVTITSIPNAADSVSVSWQPPTKPNGHITGYRILYAQRHEKQPRHTTVTGETLFAALRGLQHDADYYFQVLAINSIGHGPPSDKVVYHLPTTDGTGGHQREPGYVPYGPVNGGDTEPAREPTVGGLSRDVIWIIIAVVAIVVFLFFIAVVVYVCRRKTAHSNNAQFKQYNGNGSNPQLSGARGPPLGSGGGLSDGGVGGRPRHELWIPEQLEMQSMDKDIHTLRRQHSLESLPKTSSSRPDLDDDDLPTLSDTAERQRSAFLGGRAVATVTALPSSSAAPHYPRSQFNTPPRVHAPQPLGPHPSKLALRAAVEDPAEVRPLLEHYTDHLRPQQQLYMNTPVQVAPMPQQPAVSGKRTPKPITMPHAPAQGVMCGGLDPGGHTQQNKSYSAEELNKEMVNIEGMMKDLNAITQSDFQC